MPIVSNSSPLIALEQIHQLELLQLLFGEVLIPDRSGPKPFRQFDPIHGFGNNPCRAPCCPQLCAPLLDPVSVIAAVKPCLDALIENRFFLARTVYELILNRAGER